MRRAVALGLLALACGPSSTAPPANPEPALAESEPAESEVAEAEPAESEPAESEPAEAEGGPWVWEPNDFRTRVNAGRSGPVVGYLQTPAALEGAERRGSSLLIETAFQREGRLPLFVSIWAVRTEPFEAPEPQEAIRVATHHRVQLHIDDEVPIELGCDTIEVLEDGEGRTWARVARGGVVIEGWIEGRIEGRGPASCPPRVFQGAPGEALPEGYVAVDAPRSIPRRGSVWWLAGAGDSRECQQWRWARGGRQLQRRNDAGVASYGVERAGSRLTLTGPNFQGRRGRWAWAACTRSAPWAWTMPGSSSFPTCLRRPRAITPMTRRSGTTARRRASRRGKQKRAHDEAADRSSRNRMHFGLGEPVKRRGSGGGSCPGVALSQGGLTKTGRSWRPVGSAGSVAQ